MILKQYYLGCLAHASYLIGDSPSKTAIIVDPQRDVEQYIAEAAFHGLQIRHVFLTHFHADFLAGHLELTKARLTGRLPLLTPPTVEIFRHDWPVGGRPSAPFSDQMARMLAELAVPGPRT